MVTSPVVSSTLTSGVFGLIFISSLLSSEFLGFVSSVTCALIPPASVTLAVTLVLFLILSSLNDTTTTFFSSSKVTVNPSGAVQLPPSPFVTSTVVSSVPPSGVYLIVIFLASVSAGFVVIVISFLSASWATSGASGALFNKRSLAGIVVFGWAPSVILYEPSSFFSGTNL